ncbi:hypothetical protein C2W62_00885 [Candidatus Entotheonella serta]|nr:hypothetical protein C2W62_00885 [Candidatus Entotheonella serta]
MHEASLSRLNLIDESQVTLQTSFVDWDRFHAWDIELAIERIRTHCITPFDLEIELQEEVSLPTWQVGEEVERRREPLSDVPIETPTATFYVPIGTGAEHHKCSATRSPPGATSSRARHRCSALCTTRCAVSCYSRYPF